MLAKRKFSGHSGGCYVVPYIEPYINMARLGSGTNYYTSAIAALKGPCPFLRFLSVLDS